MKKKDREVKHWDEVPLFVDVNYIAELLRVNPSTVCRWISGGKLKAFCVGKIYRINKDDFMDFMGVSKNAS